MIYFDNQDETICPVIVFNNWYAEVTNDSSYVSYSKRKWRSEHPTTKDDVVCAPSALAWWES